MEFAYLRNILDDLRSRFNRKYSTSDFQIRNELALLNRYEKLLIRKKVLDFDYNVGALKVLKLLKDTDILSLTDYLQSISNDVDVQGIIADIFDCDDQHELLADVIISSRSSEVVRAQFDECFRQYLHDIIDRPHLIKNEFIITIEQKLTSEVFNDVIVSKVISGIMAHEHHKDVEISQVISNQMTWNQQFSNGKLKLLTQIIQRLVVKHSEEIVKLLLKQLKNNYNVNWFFTMLVIKQIDCKSPGHGGVKRFIKRSFERFHETNAIDHLYVTIIMARQAFHYATQPASTYKAWVKATFGEMHHQLRNQAKFTQTLEALESVIFFETDPQVVELHVQTPIAPPRGMNSNVHEYKQQLKVKFASLTEPETLMDLT